MRQKSCPAQQFKQNWVPLREINDKQEGKEEEGKGRESTSSRHGLEKTQVLLNDMQSCKNESTNDSLYSKAGGN